VSVQDEIFEWVQGFEAWKQELFIRASAGPELSESDVGQVAAMLLGEQDGDARPREVNRADLLEADVDREPLVIESISDIRNVNALEENQTLVFDPAGVSVVWGQNGAGKTGYSRVLKKAGRALHVEAILTNVYETCTESPAAVLTVKLGDTVRREELKLDAEPPALLARICVADYHAGQIYLSEETEVDYIPTSLAGLSRLALGLDSLKALLVRRRVG
jgi:hypothetical protein